MRTQLPQLSAHHVAIHILPSRALGYLNPPAATAAPIGSFTNLEHANHPNDPYPDLAAVSAFMTDPLRVGIALSPDHLEAVLCAVYASVRIGAAVVPGWPQLP